MTDLGQVALSGSTGNRNQERSEGFRAGSIAVEASASLAREPSYRPKALLPRLPIGNMAPKRGGEEDRRMILEILHIYPCPNRRLAGRRLEDALSATEHWDTSASYRLLAIAADGSDVSFAGSRTVTREGEDLIENGGRTNNLACRVHPTSTVTPGRQTTEQLVDAITSREQ